MFRKVLLPWLLLLATVYFSLFLPHREFSTIGYVNLGLQLLLCLLCLQMFLHDDKAFKPALLILTLFFGFAILMYLHLFVGTIVFSDDLYASVYYYQFINRFGSIALLSIAVVYLIIDFAFHKSRVLKKISVTGIIVSLFLLPLYYPFFADSLHLFRTEEYSRYLDLREAQSFLEAKSEKAPSTTEIVLRALDIRQERLGTSTQALKHKEWDKLNKMTSYLSQQDATVLFWKPLHLNAVYVNAILMLFLILFYLSKFRHDKPHGAYLEKIMLLFFILCSLQALHSWSNTVTHQTSLYYAIHDVGQYVTILILLAFVYVCSIRLRFLLSPVGQYYEHVLSAQPHLITRWRDEIDNLILKTFLRRPSLNGRLGTFEKETSTP